MRKKNKTKLLSRKTETYDKIAGIIDEFFGGIKIDNSVSLRYRYQSKIDYVRF